MTEYSEWQYTVGDTFIYKFSCRYFELANIYGTFLS